MCVCVCVCVCVGDGGGVGGVLLECKVTTVSHTHTGSFVEVHLCQLWYAQAINEPHLPKHTMYVQRCVGCIILLG